MNGINKKRNSCHEARSSAFELENVTLHSLGKVITCGECHFKSRFSICNLKYCLIFSLLFNESY